MESHGEKTERVRREYREAHARFAARLTAASDADVHRAPADGGWSAAQIGWHVAAVDSSFAGLISGDIPGAKPLAPDAVARAWPEIASGIPPKLEAGKRVQPPPDAKRDEVVKALADAVAKMDAALAGLPEDRAAGFAITHPIIGVVALGQIGEWAVAHVIRHNAQAKRTLAAGG